MTISFFELNEIRRLAGLPVFEAAPSASRLKPMFQAIIQLNPKLEPAIDNEIQWARERLEREDRVVWYLRYAQIGLLVKMSESDSTIGQAVGKKVNQLAKKSGVSPQQMEAAVAQVTGSKRFKEAVVHFLSLPIPAIQNLTWQFQLPSQLLEEFEQLEQDWREDQDRTVEADPEAEVVIDFGDGYAWYNLNKAYCSKEANAMGHCGNSPRSHTQDTILSLRRAVDVGGEPVLTPILTFILNSEGMLTEMKGRGNDKPAARYHPYIVTLLRHDVINGIQGGGYLPENNFSLSDLEDDELADELREEKPGLAGPTYWIEKAWEAGNYDEAAQALERLVDDQGLDYPGRMEFDLTNADKGMYAVTVNIGDYEDYEAVANEFYDQPVQELYKVLDELNDAEKKAGADDETITVNLVVDILQRLPEEQLNAMAEELNLGSAGDPAAAVANLMAREGENNPYHDFVKRAIQDSMGSEQAGARITELKQQVIERLEDYADAGVPLRPFSIWLRPVDNNEPLGKWVMSIGMQELMNIVEGGLAGDEDYDNEEYYNYADWKGEGIRMEEDYSHSEWRGEHSDHADKNLVGTGDHDPLWSEFDEDELEGMMKPEELPSNAAQRLSRMLSLGMTPASDTSRQMDLPLESFDEEIQEIRRLAGLI